MTRRRALLLLFLGLAAFAAVVSVLFRTDLHAARAALDGYETVAVVTSVGPVETVDAGDGFPILSIHGTGGGYDQGYALAAGLQDRGYRVIAPSRFGYLGARVPDRTDARAQADVFAELLDARDVDRAVVMGASAGAITALAFAERYPDRTAALLLMVPAYYPPARAAPEPWSPLRTRAVTRALSSDFPFWAGLRAFPKGMATTVLATDREVIEGVDAEERARLDAVLAMILPISARADGLLLHTRNTAAPPEINLDAIRVPTFIASAEDDRYRTAESARLLADGIAGADLMITPDGGHVWAGRADEVETATAAFLSEVRPEN